ncbi:SpoIIE family protein phosphatase [Amycolatopsis sp. lyj-23]|uniref:SpoIIE family protein phosphatase n=1 Tax=Amycolatopsis sp. lyj-23 TaxID=2789283 RepID=UPI00397A39AA
MGNERRVAPPCGDGDAVGQAFEQLPISVGTVHGDDYVFVAANAAYRAFSADRPILGLPARDVFAEALSQQVFEILDRTYATGVAHSGREWRIQLDRGAGLEDIYIDFTISPLLGGDGGVQGLNILITEVTEQVRARLEAQERAAEAERRYEAARDVVLELQRELLPSGVPVVPGLELAASYLLAGTGTVAGGDWFEAIALPGGRVGLIVGDVVGHGVAASATMGQLRVLLAERLAATGDVLAAIEAGDAATDRLRGGRAATVCVAVVDPGTGAVEYCTAGHPPPLVVDGGDAARYLPPTGAGPLGVAPGRDRSVVGTAELAVGDLLLLYSDGILERPGRPLGESTAELAYVAADAAADRIMPGDVGSAAERVCTQTVELLTRATGHADDITVLAAQRVPPRTALELTVVADARSLEPVRVAVDGWLAEARVAAGDGDAVRHAVVELVTNAADHAYLGAAVRTAGTHPVTVTAELTTAGWVRLRVADRGRWREPRPSRERGLGLRMVETLMDTVRIAHDEHGTTVTAGLRLTRPARLLTAGQGAPRPAPAAGKQSDPLLVLEQPGTATPRIRVDGPIDEATAATVYQEVLTAGSTGARSLTVDLTGLTHLASAGVATLHRLAAVHRENGTELVLYAPPGTPADMVLSLVQLAHLRTDPDYPLDG